MIKKTKISSKYKPTAKEPFMNQKQKQYFKQKLIDWKESLLKGSTETISNLKQEELDVDANSIIYTSGSGGIFKSGIPIGKLKKFKEINNEVEFFSNLSQLNFVTLVSFDKGENK